MASGLIAGRISSQAERGGFSFVKKVIRISLVGFVFLLCIENSMYGLHLWRARQETCGIVPIRIHPSRSTPLGGNGAQMRSVREHTLEIPLGSIFNGPDGNTGTLVYGIVTKSDSSSVLATSQPQETEEPH